jgi:L-ascorbate metabolism protein UlaG (beta-lactamase superfamily)
MQVTYLGHFCFLVEVKGFKLLFDPFISGNPLAKNIDIQKIKADYIILSHGHADHCADTLEIYKNNSSATLIAMYEITEWFANLGVKSTHPMNIGGAVSFDFGTIKMVQAVHSSTLPDGKPGGSAAGFLIKTSEGDFYFAGDTALHYDMKLISFWSNTLKFAIMPIGDNFTMGYEDACIAADFVGVDKVIGAHYDSFGYIVVSHEDAKNHFKNNQKELLLLNLEETINL